MAEPKTKPDIRYTGFTDAWEQRKLGEFTLIIMGQSPSSANYTDDPNDFILVQGNADMKNGRVIPRVWTTEVTKKAEKNDLILSVRAPVGDVGKTDFDVVLGRGVAAIRGNEFMYQSLLKMKNDGYWNRLSTGSTFDSINSADIKESLIMVPMEGEQIQIGTFLDNLDHLITLHQREYDKIVNTKKAMLEKMFPKNGEDKPEIRFTGFTDAWEQRKLGDVVEFNPKSVLPDSFEYVDLESVVGTDLVSHRMEERVSAPSRAQRLARRGDVFYQTVRPYQKNNYLFDLPYDNYVFSTGYAQMRPNIDSLFLFSKLQEGRFIKVVLDHCTGTSYPAINANDLSEIEIEVPCDRAEQVKIGMTFKRLDNLITLHQRASMCSVDISILVQPRQRSHHQLNILIFELMDDV